MLGHLIIITKFHIVHRGVMGSVEHAETDQAINAPGIVFWDVKESRQDMGKQKNGRLNAKPAVWKVSIAILPSQTHPTRDLGLSTMTPIAARSIVTLASIWQMGCASPARRVMLGNGCRTALGLMLGHASAVIISSAVFKFFLCVFKIIG